MRAHGHLCRPPARTSSHLRTRRQHARVQRNSEASIAIVSASIHDVQITCGFYTYTPPHRTNLSESIELADYTRPCETKPGKTTGREHERQYQILLLLRSLRGGTLSCPFVSAVLAVPDHRTTHMQIDDSTTSPQCRRRHALRRVSQFGPSYRVLHASDPYPGRSRHASHRHCLCYWCPGDESLL